MPLEAWPLTAASAGAIAVLAVRGPQAPAALSTLCQQTPPKPGFLRLVRLCHQGWVVDQALLLGLAPDHFELHLHGGTQVVRETLHALETLAGPLSLPVENPAAWPLNPHSRLKEELLAAMPLATTPTSLALLTAQLSDTGLQGWMNAWRWRLTRRPEAHGVAQFQDHLQWLRLRSTALAHLLTPPRVAILGAPNAGKSTLANALLGRPISLVSPQAGTTRDWVDAPALFSTPSVQLPVELIDTAGLRLTPDFIEQESIRRSMEQAAGADLIWFLIASGPQLDWTTPPWSEAWANWQSLTASSGVPMLGLMSQFSPDHPSPPAGFLAINSLERLGLQELQARTLEALGLAGHPALEPFFWTPRQKALGEAMSHESSPVALVELLTRLAGAP